MQIVMEEVPVADHQANGLVEKAVKNVQGPRGRTMLMRAARAGDAPRLRTLIAAGADLDRRCLGEGGGVVHTVTDHGDDVAIRLEPPDLLELVLGERLGDDVVDADLGGDGKPRSIDPTVWARSGIDPFVVRRRHGSALGDNGPRRVKCKKD